MANLIGLALKNFTITLLILSILATAISLFCKRQSLNKALVIDTVLAYFILFTIGIGYLYNFIMHVFFAEFTAEFIGWAPSPFQLEVGFASLGFAITGILAFGCSFGFRAATIIGPAFFLWGAAGGHIYQMVIAGNFSPGNAGSVFISDLILPIIGFALLFIHHKIPKVN